MVKESLVSEAYVKPSLLVQKVRCDADTFNNIIFLLITTQWDSLAHQVCRVD